MTQDTAATTAPAPAPQASDIEPHLRPVEKLDLGKEYLARVAARQAPDGGGSVSGSAAEASGDTHAPGSGASELATSTGAPKPPEQAPQDAKATEQLAALLRRDKDVRTREQKLKEQETEIERLRAFETSLKTDPVAAFKSAGIDFDTVAERFLAGGKVSADKRVEQLAATVDELKVQLAEKESTAKQQAEAERVASAKSSFQSEIKTFVEAAPETYEIIRAEKQEGLVYTVIEQHYNETGRVLALKEAADAVENYLTEQRRGILSLKKFAAGSTQATTPPAGGESREPSNEVHRAAGTKPPQPNPTVNASPPAPGRKTARDELNAKAAQLLRFVNTD